MPEGFIKAVACLLAAWTLSPAAAKADEPEFNLGGAVRFNYGWLDYGSSSGFEPELVRVDASGSAGNAFFSLQYRWYDGFDAVHHAWGGWKIDEASDVRVGIQQVPFGLLPYAAQSFWFGSGYYLGIEDDYDLGVVWRRGDGAHQWHAGVFFADEYGTGGRPGRYSFDVATTDDHPYRERERLNLRYENTRDWAGGELALGVSAFTGRIEDRARDGHHGHHGAALHAQWSRDAWTWQAQWARYRYDVPEARVSLSAFLFPFDIAAEADVPTLNVAYALPRSGWFDGITCYNNLSSTRPVRSDPGLRESWQNVTGCSFAKGKSFTYVDWIAGKNMWFAGGPGVGIDEPGGDGWRSRLNINIGFYF
ncbi:OprO/OprP family phosphate-selective porin [Luteimonas aestuarii]|uniref:OprO/OprP family phosphate-selective porin n=1 Tax=Luteimonas aestuarii TaxID=453837 RepID=UPI001FB67CC5|nr:OprO/OprP family phosphate-selective porin [Luteimonas aestuarii]